MKKILGFGFQAALYLGVLAFEMIESANFFFFAFKDEQWYLAYLGFFLTSIAVLLYFYDFKFFADTKLKKTVALSMMILCAVGSVVTAGFGFNVAANQHTGFNFKPEEISAMTLAIQVLIGLHILALIVYNAGDAIYEAFTDDDGDGIPNFLDRDRKTANKPQAQPTGELVAHNADVEALRAEIAALKAQAVNPPTLPTK